MGENGNPNTKLTPTIEDKNKGGGKIHPELKMKVKGSGKARKVCQKRKPTEDGGGRCRRLGRATKKGQENPFEQTTFFFARRKKKGGLEKRSTGDVEVRSKNREKENVERWGFLASGVKRRKRFRKGETIKS